MADESTINSALLTTSIKSVKLLTRLTKAQDQSLELLKKVDSQQQKDAELLQLLKNMPTKDDLVDITKAVVELSDQADQAFTNLNDLINADHKDTLDAIEQTNNAQSLEVIRKLIESVKTLGNNVTTLSSRMNTLSSNMAEVQDDTKALTHTIIDSNSRVRSMDVRMAALINQDMDDDEPLNDQSLDDDVKFLESLPNEGPNKVDEQELAKREQARQDLIHQEETVLNSEQRKRDHQDFQKLLGDLTSSVEDMPVADEEEVAKTEDTKQDD